MKECKSCKKLKPLSKFQKRDKYADGHANVCLSCSSEQIKDAAERRDPWEYTISTCSSNMKNKSKAKQSIKFVGSHYEGMEFLRKIYREQGGRCAVTGLLLQPRRVRSRNPYALSVDRLDNSLPYQEGNIRLVCMMVNYAVHEWADDDIAPLILAWAEQIQNSQQENGNDDTDLRHRSQRVPPCRRYDLADIDHRG